MNTITQRKLEANEIELLSKVFAKLMKSTKEDVFEVLSYTPGEKIPELCQNTSQYFLELLVAIIESPSLGTPEEIVNSIAFHGKTISKIILSGNIGEIQKAGSILFNIHQGNFN